MDAQIDLTDTSPMASPLVDPRIARLLDAADHAIVVIDTRLADNERIMAGVA